MDDVHYCVDGKPHPEVEKQLLVYVGLNSKIVEEDYKEETKKFRSKHEFEVEKAYTPSKWNGIMIFSRLFCNFIDIRYGKIFNRRYLNVKYAD